MYIVGIDLSGPANTVDTFMTVFEQDESSGLKLIDSVDGADDMAIYDTLRLLVEKGPVSVGMDAPLSYNPGGGDRPGDADLRKQIISMGMRPGSVMPPTLTKMVYLTLRGVSLSRLFQHGFREKCQIVEVHPGAAMVLRGAPVNHVIQFKKNPVSRRILLEWLESKGLNGILSGGQVSDHYVASCACAYAVRMWSDGRIAWEFPADPPLHPFHYIC